MGWKYGGGYFGETELCGKKKIWFKTVLLGDTVDINNYFSFRGLWYWVHMEDNVQGFWCSYELYTFQPR